MNTKRAVAMFSGGLDSSLAIAIIREQGVEVIAVNFQTPFNSPRKAEGGPDKVEQMAGQLGVELVRKYFLDEYLEILRSPSHGYGRGLNPCIDCRIFFIKKAAEIMKDRDAGFIITGEVIGQRPMSQRRNTIPLIDRESRYGGLILRPLSAKLLPPTIPEEKGWVDRDQLFDISGRTRTRQMELAEGYEIEDYPTPAGGCLLTEPEYSRKLEDLFRHLDDISGRDIDLLKRGRHFRLSGGVKIVVGKDDADNRRIIELAGEDDFLIESDAVPGPTTLIQGRPGSDEIELSAKITARYIRKGAEESLTFKVMKGPGKKFIDRIETSPLDAAEIEDFRI